MNQKLLAFFSGFPSCRFPRSIGTRLDKELNSRESLVFVSAWPEDYSRNDDDSAGMYNMFEEYDIPFERYCVIDNRTTVPQACQLIREASCIFLMGGHPGYQMMLLREKKLVAEIQKAKGAVLGVSAGSINMAKHSLDTKDSPIPYDGLGLANITLKPHFSTENEEELSTLLLISHRLPICAAKDDSAIFISDENVSFIGEIYWIDKGKMAPLSMENLMGINGIGN